MRLHHVFQIDTCPLCGAETHAIENGYIGERRLDNIPGDTVFMIECKNKCGKFVITKVDVNSPDDDWRVSYVIAKDCPVCEVSKR